MATIHSHQPTVVDRSPGDWMWPSAFGVAALWHIVLIVLLASFRFHIRLPHSESLDTRWAEVTAVDELEVIENQPIVSLESLDSGGARAQLASAAGLIDQRPRVTISPARVVVHSAAQTTYDLAPNNLAERIPGVIHSGFGDGKSDGKPGSFFGTEPNGHRFVFVVDRSLSMNHPHESEARTRFRRLKLELLRSIANLSDDMYFYIIFFSDGPTPMPARSMQRATPEARQRYLNWMARIPAGGQTDPRGALAHALRLRPDVVYFLTDGSFTNNIQQELRKLVQKRSIIHTYAFGDPVGESLMKWVARANGGKYTYIP